MFFKLGRTVNLIIVEFHSYIFFHLLVIRKMQVIIVFVLAELAVDIFIPSANPRPFRIYPAFMVSRQMPALIINADVPVLLFYEYRNAFMHKIPPDIVEIAFFCRRFYRQSDISATQSGTFMT